MPTLPRQSVGRLSTGRSQSPQGVRDSGFVPSGSFLPVGEFDPLRPPSPGGGTPGAGVGRQGTRGPLEGPEFRPGGGIASFRPLSPGIGSGSPFDPTGTGSPDWRRTEPGRTAGTPRFPGETFTPRGGVEPGMGGGVVPPGATPVDTFIPALNVPQSQDTGSGRRRGRLVDSFFRLPERGTGGSPGESPIPPSTGPSPGVGPFLPGASGPPSGVSAADGSFRPAGPRRPGESSVIRSDETGTYYNFFAFQDSSAIRVNITKDGFCTRTTDRLTESSECVEGCNTDSLCPGIMKCCPIGCSLGCVDAYFPDRRGPPGRP